MQILALLCMMLAQPVEKGPPPDPPLQQAQVDPQTIDPFEVLVVIDLVAILLFDLVLFALKIEVANIVHDLSLGAAYILAMIGILHRSGVQISGIIATSAVVTAVLALSLQATLGNILG